MTMTLVTRRAAVTFCLAGKPCYRCRGVGDSENEHGR